MTTETKSTGREESRFRRAVVLAVVVAGLLAYANALTADFVWDDVSSILLHEHVKDPSHFFTLFKEDLHAFGRGQGNFYRPLLAATFMAEYQFAAAGATPEQLAGRVPEISPYVFHLSNVLWHVAVAILFFALLTRLGAPRPVRAFVPLLYAIHPLHTEAVTYISGRGDSMAAAFVLAALLASLMEGSQTRRTVGAVLTGLFFLGGLLSKESATIFPFLLALFVFLRPTPPGRDPGFTYARRAASLGVAAAVLAAYAYARFTFLSFARGGSGNLTSLGQRLVEAGQAFALYIRLIFVPAGLHMERTLEGVPGWVSALGYLLLAACVVAFYLGLRRGHYRLAIAIGWFLVTWFPISGIIPLNAPMAEHWLYLPLAGFLWAVGEAVALVLHRPAARRVAVAAVGIACVCFIGLTLDRNRDWHDNATLYEATLRENPKSARVHFNLAVTYHEVLRNNPAGAARHYEKYLELAESQGQGDSEQALEARVSLGNLLYEQGRYDEAARVFMPVSTQAPTDQTAALIATAVYGLGRAQLKLGDVDSAMRMFEQAVQVRPDLRPEVRDIVQGLSLMGPS
jgi:tetratricopeptide (TPR) repeat protein